MAAAMPFKISSVSASGAVRVKVSATGINKPRGGYHVLTTGGGFNAEGVSVSLDEGSRPDWAAGISVNGDGNIVLNVKPGGFTLSVR